MRKVEVDVGKKSLFIGTAKIYTKKYVVAQLKLIAASLDITNATLKYAFSRRSNDQGIL